MSENEVAQDKLVTLTADIVAAHVSNNVVASAEMPGLITNVFSALAGLRDGTKTPAPKVEPSVSIRASVKPDYIICLEDGKKLKMLKRYLRTNYNMTPEEYRVKWSLPFDYPMVAPNYAAKRKELAHKIGLGRKSAAEPSAPPVTRPRKSKLKLEFA